MGIRCLAQRHFEPATLRLPDDCSYFLSHITPIYFTDIHFCDERIRFNCISHASTQFNTFTHLLEIAVTHLRLLTIQQWFPTVPYRYKGIVKVFSSVWVDKTWPFFLLNSVICYSRRMTKNLKMDDWKKIWHLACSVWP